MLKRTRKAATFTLLISGLLANTLARAEDKGALPNVPGNNSPSKSTQPAFAPQDKGSQFSLSLDAMGQALIYSPFLSTTSFGAGGQGFVDWRPIQYLSFGVGGQYAYFFGSSVFKLTSVDLGGRIFPLPIGTTPGGEFYLQGGVGLNLLVLPPARGHFHGYAGPGFRKFLGTNLALDMGAQYDFYSPIGASSHGAAVKFGLTFLFGRTEWPKPEEKIVESVETVPMGYQQGAPFYTWKVGDDLRKVSAKVYGDPAFYSLLVDANRDLLLHPAQLREGAQLRVRPLPFTPEALDNLRDLSLHDPGYLRFQKITENLPYDVDRNWSGPSLYRWREQDSLPSVAQKLYGDEDLYPILVDANESRLIHPANLQPGVRLIVPKPPAGAWVEVIHEKAWLGDKYRWWKVVSEIDKADQSK